MMTDGIAVYRRFVCTVFSAVQHDSPEPPEPERVIGLSAVGRRIFDQFFRDDSLVVVVSLREYDGNLSRSNIGKQPIEIIEIRFSVEIIKGIAVDYEEIQPIEKTGRPLRKIRLLMSVRHLVNMDGTF